MADPLFSLTRIFGVNNTDPPTSIGENQCVTAMNVEFDKSALGERRNGCTDVDLPASITGNANIQAITFLHRNLPTTDETASELWVMGQHLTTQNVVMSRKTTSWTDATFTDAIEVTANQGFEVKAQTLHGKMFLAYPSSGAVDRLHVVDTSGTAVRRCGLAEPAAAPTGADTGTPGTAFTGTRYYRVRYIVMSGSTVLRRSEPSDALTFAPSGTGTAARITKPASISESETHWELEASTDNANFYVIATTIVATTTFDDSTLYATGYAVSYPLSEDIGDYALIHSGKFLAADEDRLLIGGSWEDTALASRVAWTPVYADPGDGNDERIPTDTANYIDLDGFEGGPLTHLSNSVNGAIWAFKRSHTYKLVRTGQRSRAYVAYNISKSLGALPGSVVEGVDQYGMPCLYALDPEVGPWRTGGSRLITSASQDILTTWRTVNINAIIACRGIYYPESRQVKWWLSTSSANYPDLMITLQTTHTRETDDGIRNGWSMANGKIATAYATCLYAENIDANTTRSLVLRPFIGVTSANGYVLRCDTGSDDNGTAFAAQIVTKPYVLGSLLRKFKVLASALLAKVHATADIKVTLVRDFGLEEPHYQESTLAAAGSETHVIKQLDDLVGSELYALQVKFDDVTVPTGQWQLNRMDMALSAEESKAKGK